MDKKKLKILLIIMPIVTVLAIVLCVVIAKMDSKSEDESKSESQNESKSEGFELDTDSVNSFAICKGPDCVFVSDNSLCVCKNGVLMMYDKNGDSKEFDTELNIVKGIGEGGSLYFIDDKGGLYGFDTESEKAELLLSGVSDVTHGGTVYGAVTTDGKLYLWGKDVGKYVGTAVKGTVARPTEYKSDVHWKALSFKTQHLLALDDNGNVYESERYEDSDTSLKKAEGLKDIVQIHCGCNNIAISKDGHISVWNGIYGSDVMPVDTDAPKQIEDKLNDVKPTHFEFGGKYDIAYNDSGAYFWGVSGLSRENKSTDSKGTPTLVKSFGGYDSIYCGGNVIFKKNGTKVTAYCLHY